MKDNEKLLEPAFAYRFKIRTEFMDSPSEPFTLNVNSFEVNLVEKSLLIEVRGTIDPALMIFFKNMHKAKPDFVVDIMSNGNNSSKNAHAIRFSNSIIKSHTFKFDYAVGGPLLHNIAAIFDDVIIESGE